MLLKVRSNLIIKNIFKNVKLNLKLNLIKYNKKLQKKFDISLKDYISFKEIELEIIPAKSIIGKEIFINIEEKNKHNFIIYFDDTIKNRNFITDNDNAISKIKIIIKPLVKSFKGLFYGCKCIKEIKFLKFNRNDIFDMSEMFYDCNELVKIDFSCFNTSKVKYMYGMFCCCLELKELDLSNFDTSKVENMKDMFYNCN